MRVAAACLGWVLAATVCQATNNCPWLNEATASGLLGGDAVGEYTAGTGGQASVCTFTQKDAAATRTLRVSVQVTPDFEAGFRSASQSCGTDGFSLHAIGNEAVACSADERKGAWGERAVGRVRDQVFTITISSSLKSDMHLSREMLKSKIYTAAEQVAGNLY